MINNFPEQTKPLTDYELNTLLPLIIEGLRHKQGEQKAITNVSMCKALQGSRYRINPPRMRAIIHHIRVNDILPFLVSTSKGYYIADSRPEIMTYIESLEQRISSISVVKNALKRQLNDRSNGQVSINF